MNYLLDTQVVIWALTGDGRLSHKATEIIEDTTNFLYVSLASVWEIGIKSRLHKENFVLQNGVEDFLKFLKFNGIIITDITTEQIKIIEKLPLIHRDPFDRIIIAASQVNNYVLVTADEKIQEYDIEYLW